MKDPDLMDRVRSWAPDMFLVAGWYHMVPRPWREMAPAYGLHSSLLPDYSGGAPLVWAMINGETKTGITLFQLADGVDSGPVVGQLAADILPEDTIATLYQRIESLGIELLVKQLPRLANGSAQLTPQDESRRRLFPQRGPEDGIIDWSRPACQIYNFIRAQTKPYPGAFTFHQADKVTIWSSQLVPHKHFPFPPCGQIKTMDGQIFVGCGNESVLEITHIGMNGIDMPASIWWRERNKPGNNNAFSASLGKKEDAARP
ncbi:MAG: methionyl-tRNA formyltransferase [Elusimicrobia bacterium]|nr:methionyl-tRNA formyltransferase [Elusimicrobiota bacterium]